MIPGPVMLHPRVLQAMSRQMISHRDKAFSAIYDECRFAIRDILNTKNDTYVLTGSGSSAMEAAISNLVKGDRIVSIVNGKFGERFRDIGQRYGQVESLEFEWGTPVDLTKVEEALAKAPAKVVAMVHNETSAGVKNPAEEVGRLAKKYGALFVMDTVTSAGGDLVEADKWGVDIAVTGSQKCLGAPSGLASVSVSQKAWDSMVKNPPYYLDLKKYKKSAEKEGKAETPYTPAISLFFGMQEAMKIIREEGIANRIARHRKGAEAVRAAARAIGLELFPVTDGQTVLSNTVTAIRTPAGIADKDLRGTMKASGVTISGGQDRLDGKIFRIPSMNAFTEDDLARTIGLLEQTLTQFKVIEKPGAGAEALRKVYKN
jgi:aspartate aminotransferase-like enzyme